RLIKTYSFYIIQIKAAFQFLGQPFYYYILSLGVISLKRIIFYFIILVILIGGLLIYQWENFSSTSSEKVNTIQQSIKIKHTQNKLQVEQTMTGMKEKSYTIKIPDNVSNFTCVNMNEAERNEAECNLDKSNLLILEDEKVTFQYDLPVDEKVKVSFCKITA